MARACPVIVMYMAIKHLAQITGELISSEIEIVSGRGDDLHDAIARQRDLRRRLFALAASRGVRLGATATHPFADYREQRNIDTEHYRRVVDGLGYQPVPSKRCKSHHRATPSAT